MFYGKYAIQLPYRYVLHVLLAWQSMFPFINPKTDFAFKKIFGAPQNKDILISFLNAMLYEGTATIQDLRLLDPYQAPPVKGIKESFLDVKANLSTGETVIIKMQVLNVLGFKKRVFYNAAKALSIQLETGDSYNLLNPVIALTITDFVMFEQSDKVVSRYKLKEKDELTDYSDDIELVFAELPKFQKSIDDLESLTDKWLYFLKEANHLEAIPDRLSQDPAIQNAFEVARKSLLTRDEMESLDRQAMFIHDSQNAVLLGVQRGMKQGIEQGIKQGERRAQMAIARSLLTDLPVEKISEKTGLSIREIEQLRAAD